MMFDNQVIGSLAILGKKKSLYSKQVPKSRGPPAKGRSKGRRRSTLWKLAKSLEPALFGPGFVWVASLNRFRKVRHYVDKTKSPTNLAVVLPQQSSKNTSTCFCCCVYFFELTPQDAPDVFVFGRKHFFSRNPLSQPFQRLWPHIAYFVRRLKLSS